jgi:hypothetical protein
MGIEGISMKTDKELLVACARAARYTCMNGFGLDESLGMRLVERNGEFKRFWNPLKDDGDLFRLLVDVGLAGHELNFSTEELAEATKIGYAAVRRIVVNAIGYQV